MPHSKSRKTETAPAVETQKLSATGLVAAFAEKIKELVRLGKEQGQLTFEDVNEVLTEEFSTPAYLDQVLAKLRELEIEVVDAAELDVVKPVDKEEEDDDNTQRMDALDDPVRMYLK